MLRRFFQRVKIFFRIIFTVQNWPSLLIYKAGLKKSLIVKFRKGNKLEITKDTWVSFMSYVNFFYDCPQGEVKGDITSFEFNGGVWRFDCGRWGPSAVSEVFCADIYGRFLKDGDVLGRDILDIGAWVGDTPVYFAARGAKRVYGFEPAPYEYQLAFKNVELNRVSNICHLENAAVGGRKGELVLDPKWAHMFGSNIKQFEKGVKVPIVTLEEIVNRFGIKNGLLKADCEGYEYDIFLNTSDEVLRKFDLILLEYHYGAERLKERLESAGFKVEYTEPSWHYDAEKEDSFKEMSVGFLLAQRTSS